MSADTKYNELIVVVEREYEKLEEEINDSIDELQNNLLAICCDKSYLNNFQSQIKRIQSSTEAA